MLLPLEKFLDVVDPMLEANTKAGLWPANLDDFTVLRKADSNRKIQSGHTGLTVEYLYGVAALLKLEGTAFLWPLRDFIAKTAFRLRYPMLGSIDSKRREKLIVAPVGSAAFNRMDALAYADSILRIRRPRAGESEEAALEVLREAGESVATVARSIGPILVQCGIRLAYSEGRP